MEDFSLIILCRGRRHLLPLTLDTLKAQTGAFEVILLDGEGTGRLSELAHRYPELKIKVQEATGYTLPRMMNRGVELASGRYVQFLEPGDRYISQHGLAFLTELIGQRPYFITAQSVAPDVQSHWFSRKNILESGGFDEKLSYRPLLDFLFRLQKKGETPLVCSRVIVDKVAEGAGGLTETCKILYRHFGLWHALKWIWGQDHSQLLHRAAGRIKQAFWKS